MYGNLLGVHSGKNDANTIKLNTELNTIQ